MRKITGCLIALMLIASGGAGAPEHFRDAFVEADVDGAGAVDDTTCNEADGLSCPTATPTL